MPLSRICLVTLLTALPACTDPSQWTLFYYPDAATQANIPPSKDAISGYYATLEQCRAKGNGLLRLNRDNDATYVCGHLCVVKANALSCEHVALPKH